MIFFAVHSHAEGSINFINSQAKDPNIKYLLPTTRDAPEAMYLLSWTKKIERVGNLNYPEQAKKNKLEGKAIIYVSIAKDGSLINSLIIQSTGHIILDDAAKRIVKLAEPFAPIPDKVLDGKSHVVIIKTWNFSSKSKNSKPTYLKRVEKK